MRIRQRSAETNTNTQMTHTHTRTTGTQTHHELPGCQLVCNCKSSFSFLVVENTNYLENIRILDSKILFFVSKSEEKMGRKDECQCTLLFD